MVEGAEGPNGYDDERDCEGVSAGECHPSCSLGWQCQFDSLGRFEEETRVSRTLYSRLRSDPSNAVGSWPPNVRRTLETKPSRG